MIDCGRSGDLPRILAQLDRRRLALLANDRLTWARPDQTPPGDPERPWTTWLIMGGRGSGKTYAGAAWVRAMALGDRRVTRAPAGRIALIGETFAEVREVMVEGVSGLFGLRGDPHRPRFERTRRRLVWPNGSIAQLFSAEDPESLRGPQFDAAWLDELAKWRHAEATFDMLQFGLRLGDRPRQVVTTTPRPVPILRRLIEDPRTVMTRARTADNALNLAPGFLETIVGRYAGTRLGRQELDGELIDDRPDALWTRAQLEALRVDAAPSSLTRIVVAVDPPASSSRRADRCGIVCAGVDGGGTVFVLEDATLAAARPATWATRVAALARRHEADAVVVEVNQGGEMVEQILSGIDPGLPIRPVRATRGKLTRAEPVAHLYEQGRVRHVGAFPALEDELCDFGPNAQGYGLSTGRSPDRLDALVWAVTALALGPRQNPRVRRL